MAHPLGGLRALAYPVVDARQIELELLLVAARDRIEKAHVLQARTTLALAAVGDDDVIEGLIARPTPRQANGYHDRIALIAVDGTVWAAQKRARILRNTRFLRHFFAGRAPCADPGGSAAREPRRHAPLEGSHEGPQATALHALHDALHLQELLEQAVHVLNLDAGAGGDAPPARAVDDSGVAPLPPRHGIDDGDLAPHLPVALIGRHRTLFHRRPRQLVDERPDATHLLQLFELAAQV